MIVAFPIAGGDNARTAPAICRSDDGFTLSPRSQPPGPFGFLVGTGVVIGSQEVNLLHAVVTQGKSRRSALN